MNKDPSWSKSDVKGPNEKLLLLASKLSEAAKLGLQEKIAKMQAHVSLEAKKYNHPELDKLVRQVNSIKVV
jgi:hypothetical protein